MWTAMSIVQYSQEQQLYLAKLKVMFGFYFSENLFNLTCNQYFFKQNRNRNFNLCFGWMRSEENVFRQNISGQEILTQI